ncbi:hypothetical protein F5H01DRAFT_397280 [Linnemannia elongata]|nr:hypothetical protein F5H01DRAFT_397280 [Linnemannia elongata]
MWTDQASCSSADSVLSELLLCIQFMANKLPLRLCLSYIKEPGTHIPLQHFQRYLKVYFVFSFQESILVIARRKQKFDFTCHLTSKSPSAATINDTDNDNYNYNIVTFVIVTALAMPKSSSVQVLLASIVPVSVGANTMVGVQNSSISDVRCTYPSCVRGARRCTPRPHSTFRLQKSSPNITATTTTTTSSSSFSTKTTTATTSRCRTTLSGSTKWLLIATLVMISFPGLLPFKAEVSTVEAAPMPQGPTHPSHCPDEGQCNFACKLHYYKGGICEGPSQNVCVCQDLEPGY